MTSLEDVEISEIFGMSRSPVLDLIYYLRILYTADTNYGYKSTIIYSAFSIRYSLEQIAI